jgi:hypothetical protein
MVTHGLVEEEMLTAIHGGCISYQMDFPRVGSIKSHQYHCGRGEGHQHHAPGETVHVSHSDRTRFFDKAHAPPGAHHGKTSKVN